MKKILSLLVLGSMFTTFGITFADNSVLTVGDMMTRYYSELFPVSDDEIENIVVEIKSVPKDSPLEDALQKAIYFGLVKNTKRIISFSKNATERDLTTLLQKHFGSTVVGDRSTLTDDEYGAYMARIRSSFVYSLIRGEKTTPPTPQISITPVNVNSTGLSQVSQYPILDNVYNLLQDNYLRANEVTNRDLIYGASEGLVNALGDPFTQFMRPSDSKDFYRALDGTLVGIGVVIDESSVGGLKVNGIITKSPAQEAGLEKGDIITKIDDVDVNTKDGLTDEVNHIRGKEGTKVDITYSRNNRLSTITITRREIQIELVAPENLGNAYVITFREVGFGTDVLMKKALTEFLESKKTRLILDLRNNPGGSLDETRKILNFFIPNNKILFAMQNRKETILIKSDKDPIADWNKYEIVILVDAGTASAAEVITASLREYFPKTLTIIGEKTYGKGTVQELANLSDNSLLKYTVARWLSPLTLTSYDHNGINPDVIVKFDKDLWKSQNQDNQLKSAIEYTFAK